MTLRLIFRATAVMLLSSCPASLSSQQPDDTSAARAFVKGFYEWYWPRTARTKRTLVYADALKEKPDAFTTELRTALQADLDAAPDYDQGRRVPDGPALALLRVAEREPTGGCRGLAPVIGPV